MKKNITKIVSSMEETLRMFGTTLIRLNEDNNLVLGGSHALILNGIKTKRNPDDVDIILYNPTDRQYKILDSLKDFNTLDSSSGVFKFKTTKNNKEHTLDILIENTSVPKNLLYYINGKINIRVQNVNNIIKAKVSYNRKKDLLDLISLNKLNFNIDEY